jgi:small GTP-binding protein
MPINAHPGYLAAEKEYLAAETKNKKIIALKKMISLAPSHKGAENLRAQLKRRLAKLKYTNEKEIKKKKSKREGIKKEDMQAVIIGMTNVGKSSLLSLLTNVQPEVANYEFTTKKPVVGMMDYGNVKVQLIDLPAFESEFYDKGLVNSADTILIVITNLNQLEEIEEDLEIARGKRIIIFNKTDLLNELEKRKIAATLQSKKYDYILVSAKTEENIEELKNKIFQSFDKIRIYTKDPGKTRKTDKPIILNPGATVKDVAEKILHGFLKQVKETKIWGPSSKFPGQKIGLKHELKDLDVVEFKTK